MVLSSSVDLAVVLSDDIGCGFIVAGKAISDYCDDGELNLSAGEYIKSGLKGAVTGAITGGLGSVVSSLGVVARIGIEGTGDFIVDIGDQLISSGFKLSEISLG